MLMLYCLQSTNLIHKLKQQSKSIKNIHQIHAQIITRGLLSLNPSLLLTTILHTFNSLLPPSPSPSPSPAIHRHVSIQYPLSVFNKIVNPSTFSFNTILRSHTLLFLPKDAVFFFSQMRRRRLAPDAHTFPFVLKACGQLRDLSLAKTLHSQSFKFGFLVDVFVCNNLIRVYCLCGHVFDAYNVFDESPDRDVVSYNLMLDGFVKAGEVSHARQMFEEMPIKDKFSWGTMLTGFVQMKQYDKCFKLYDQMLRLGVHPDNIALVSVLSACARVGKLEKGREIHGLIKRNNIELSPFLSTGLVDFYCKCGCIETAREIFESSPEKNIFTWNAILMGLAMHGYGKLLLEYFSKMVTNGIKPDRFTFLGVLAGCSHAGLINEARHLFGEMESVYGVPRDLKHYGCIIDLLGRAGLIKEARKMIETLPIPGDVSVWGSLLGGCRVHGNIEIGEKAAEQIMEISPEDGGVYSTMADIYANAKRWDDFTKIRRLKDSKMVKKTAGCSLLIEKIM